MPLGFPQQIRVSGEQTDFSGPLKSYQQWPTCLKQQMFRKSTADD